MSTPAEALAAAAAKKPKTQKIAIKMSDGRTCEFTEKQRVSKDWMANGSEWKPDGPSPDAVRFDFPNGETRTVSCDAGGLGAYFKAHGVSQKFGDEGAGEESADDFVIAFDMLNDQIQSGDWRAERAGGGFGGLSELAKALVELTKKTAEEIRAFLQPLSKQEKDALRASRELKPIIDRLTTERLAKAKPIDTAALLGKLAG